MLNSGLWNLNFNKSFNTLKWLKLKNYLTGLSPGLKPKFVSEHYAFCIGFLLLFIVNNSRFEKFYYLHSLMLFL